MQNTGGGDVFTGQLKTFHSMFLSSRCRMKACSIPFQRKSYIAGQAVFLRKRGKKCGGEVVERLKNVIVFICGLCVGCRKPRGPGLSLFVIEEETVGGLCPLKPGCSRCGAVLWHVGRCCFVFFQGKILAVTTCHVQLEVQR